MELLHLALRASQVILSIIILGLTGYVANWWNNYWRDMSPGEVDFLIFDCVFTIFSLAYLIIVPWKVPRYSHRFANIGVEGLTMVLWFAGFIALAVFLSSRVCFGNVCNVAKAAVAFSAIQWLLFTATTGLSCLIAFRSPRMVPRGKEIDPPMVDETPMVISAPIQNNSHMQA